MIESEIKLYKKSLILGKTKLNTEVGNIIARLNIYISINKILKNLFLSL